MLRQRHGISYCNPMIPAPRFHFRRTAPSACTSAVNDGVTTATLELDLGTTKRFNVIRLQEPIQMGQRVAAYRVEAWQGGTWQTISEGTTIGHMKLDRLDTPVNTAQVRLVIGEALAEPLIAEIGLFLDSHGAEH